MDTVNFLRWRTKSFFEHNGRLVLDVLSYLLIAKIERFILMKGNSQQHHRVNVSIIHGLRLIACQEANFSRILENILPVLVSSAVNDLEVGVDKLCFVFSHIITFFSQLHLHVVGNVVQEQALG